MNFSGILPPIIMDNRVQVYLLPLVTIGYTSSRSLILDRLKFMVYF